MNRAQESTVDADSPPLRQYFSSGQWWFYFFLIVSGLALRWFALDLRPYHHDESLHGMYGKYFFDFPDQNYYKYQALLHGPFMYNLWRIVYNTLGQGDWAARAPMALVGSTLIFVPLLFRRFFSPVALLGLTAAVALSPILIYWSRFFREDILLVACMAGMLYGIVQAAPARKAFVFLFALSVHFCIKENAYVLLAILFGYLVYEALICRLVLGDGETLAGKMWRYVKRYRLATFNAFVFAAFFYCYLYSAGFRYAKGILDGLYRESLVYWFHQHSIDRIAGPFLFHFYTLSWYEGAFVICFFLYLWTFYRRAGGLTRALGIGFVAVGLAVSLWLSGRPVHEYKWADLLKLKDSYDVFAFFVFVPQSIIATTVHLLQRDRRLAFFGYLFLAHLCTYSYLGEKVPWLTVYPFVTGLVYLALYFDRYFQTYPVSSWRDFPVSRIMTVVGTILVVLGALFVLEAGSAEDLYWVWFGLAFIVAAVSLQRSQIATTVNLQAFLFAAFCIYTARNAVLTNYVYAGEAREYMSQVHTTPEFHNIANSIKEEIAHQLKGYKPQVLVMGEATWPMTWYMRDIPQYKFQAVPSEYKNFDYIITNWSENQQPAPPDFYAQRINLRGWWVPDFRQMTLKNFLGYALNHTPWGPTGYSYVWLLVNPNRPPPSR